MRHRRPPHAQNIDTDTLKHACVATTSTALRRTVLSLRIHVHTPAHALLYRRVLCSRATKHRTYIYTKKTPFRRQTDLARARHALDEPKQDFHVSQRCVYSLDAPHVQPWVPIHVSIKTFGTLLHRTGTTISQSILFTGHPTKSRAHLLTFIHCIVMRRMHCHSPPDHQPRP